MAEYVLDMLEFAFNPPARIINLQKNCPKASPPNAAKIASFSSGALLILELDPAQPGGVSQCNQTRALGLNCF
jgi:hypothetical protein